MVSDPRFSLVTTFPVTVPARWYYHATALATFKTDHFSDLAYLDCNLTDENFVNVTKKLVPGHRFLVKVFQIKEAVSSEDCLAFLRSQQAVLTGAQGLTLAYEQGKYQLPKGCRHLSFDKKKALWKDTGGSHRVPYAETNLTGGFGVCLDRFENDWGDGFCLLCFCDENE